jgi:hypothetical protein
MTNKRYIDKDEHRHWCSISEPFTGCDALLAALDQGWKLTSFECQRRIWIVKERRICIFYFELQYEARSTCMAVIHNPKVDRFIQRMGLQIVDIHPVEKEDIATVVM